MESQATETRVENAGERIKEAVLGLPAVDGRGAKIEAGATETGGWWGIVGRLCGGPAVDLQLWLDRFARRTEFTFWYGVAWERVRDFTATVPSLTGRRGQPIDFLNKHVGGPDDACYLKTPLTDARLGDAYLERYDNDYFFGEYAPASTRVDSLAKKARAFFRNCLHEGPRIVHTNLLPRGNDPIDGPITDIEQKTLVSEFRWNRSSTLARERKAKDNWVCDACGFRFEDFYGPLGAQYAEAHHRQPLSTVNEMKKVTSIAELATLCANCHRMVHRSDAADQADPVAYVKRMIRKHGSRPR